MSNKTNTPSRIDIIDACEVIRRAALTEEGANAVRHALEQRYNPELITLIRGTYEDSERFCRGMEQMFADPKPEYTFEEEKSSKDHAEWEANIAKYGY